MYFECKNQVLKNKYFSKTCFSSFSTHISPKCGTRQCHGPWEFWCSAFWVEKLLLTLVDTTHRFLGIHCPCLCDHHHHHLFLKQPFLPRSARVRRFPWYEASPHFPDILIHQLVLAWNSVYPKHCLTLSLPAHHWNSWRIYASPVAKGLITIIIKSWSYPDFHLFCYIVLTIVIVHSYISHERIHSSTAVLPNAISSSLLSVISISTYIDFQKLQCLPKMSFLHSSDTKHTQCQLYLFQGNAELPVIGVIDFYYLSSLQHTSHLPQSQMQVLQISLDSSQNSSGKVLNEVLKRTALKLGLPGGFVKYPSDVFTFQQFIRLSSFEWGLADCKFSDSLRGLQVSLLIPMLDSFSFAL